MKIRKFTLMALLLLVASCNEEVNQQEVAEETTSVTCNACNGTGIVYGYYGSSYCYKCGGTGQTRATATYNVSFRGRSTNKIFFCNGDNCEGDECVYTPGNTPNICKKCTDHITDHKWKFK